MNTYCVLVLGQQTVNILYDQTNPNNLVATAYSGDMFVVIDEAEKFLHVQYTLSDGTVVTGWLPKTYISRGWVSQPGTVIATYNVVNTVHLVPPVEKILTPYGDGATLIYGVIVPEALNVRASQPDPITGALDPNILGQVKKGDVVEITGGNPSTCPTKASRINFKKDGQWVKGWITDKYTDPRGWNYPKDSEVQSFVVAYVNNMATYTPSGDTGGDTGGGDTGNTDLEQKVIELEGRMTQLEAWQAKIRSA